MKKRLLTTTAIIFVFLLSLSSCLGFSFESQQQTEDVTKQHEHNYSEEYLFDNEQHWLECQDEKCGEKKDLTPHTWDEGKIIASPTYTSEGVCEYTCTSCAAKTSEPIDMLEKQDSLISFANGFTLDKIFDATPVVLNDSDYTVVGAGEVTIEWYCEGTKLDSAPFSVGEYTLKMMVSETEDYNGTEVTLNFTITKLVFDANSIKIDGVDELDFAFCQDEDIASYITYTGEFVDLLGAPTVEYVTKTSDNEDEWVWSTVAPTAIGDQYALRLAFEGNDNVEATYSAPVDFSIGEHVMDFKGECKNCDLSYLQKIELDTNFNVDFTDPSDIYYYFDMELGQLYETNVGYGDTYPTFHFYNEDGELLASKASSSDFLATIERYYIVVENRSSSYNDVNLTLSEATLPYEEEGVTVYTLEEGTPLTITLDETNSIWLKIDNTDGKYNKHIILSTEIFTQDNATSINGMFKTAWTGAGIASYENVCDISNHSGNVIYYNLKSFDKEAIGKEVTFNLVKVTSHSSSSKPITLGSEKYVTADGYMYIDQSVNKGEIYEVSGDLGSIYRFASSKAEYLGEKDGVHYFRAINSFSINFIIKIENEEGSLLIVKHTEHTEHEEGKCICGAEITPTE